MAILDELSSGVHATAAPDIERSLGLTHAATTAALFFVPGLVSLVAEPILFLVSDRIGRAWLVRGGLAAMAAMQFVAALAPGPVILGCALSVWSVGTGVATSLAEVTLLDQWPERRARTVARWSLLSLAGDLLSPAMLGGLALLGYGTHAWRIGFVISGSLLGVWAIAICLRAFPAVVDAPDEDEPSLWQAVRVALRDRALIAWLFGMDLCNLLDEILIVFASIHVRDDLGASATEQSVVVGAFLVGGAIGLVALDRLLARHAERRLMIATGIACAVVFAVWLAAPTVWLSALLMVAVGATAAPLYPLATAQAYARSPERSSVVLVAGQLFAPLALTLPWLLGVVADHAGAMTALTLLILEPVGLVVLAVATRAAGRRATGGHDSRSR